MPTVTCEKELFFQALGKTLDHDGFDELLFQYGLELDEDVRPVTSDRAESVDIDHSAG